MWLFPRDSFLQTVGHFPLRIFPTTVGRRRLIRDIAELETNVRIHAQQTEWTRVLD